MRRVDEFYVLKKPYAPFGEVTWKVTSRFQVCLSDQKEISCIQLSGWCNGSRITLRYDVQEFKRIFKPFLISQSVLSSRSVRRG